MSELSFQGSLFRVLQAIKDDQINVIEAQVAILNLIKTTIGEDDDLAFARDFHDNDLAVDVKSRNQLRHELLAAFGIEETE